MARDLSPPEDEAMDKAVAILREHFRCVVIVAKYEDAAGDGKVYSGVFGSQSEGYGMAVEWIENFEWSDDDGKR